MHEESHYIEGHLHFLQQRKQLLKSVGDSDKKVLEPGLDDFIRGMEYQADLRATQATSQLFLEGPHMPFDLPEYCADCCGYLRLMMTSIGCIMLMTERNAYNFGYAAEYPKPRTRLVTMMKTCINHFYENRERFFLEMDEDSVFYSLVGTLQDLWIACQCLSKTDDDPAKYEGIGQPTENFKHREPLETIVSPEDIHEIMYTVFAKKDGYQVNETIKELWLKEYEQIKSAHDIYFASVLDLFSRMAMNEFWHMKK